MTNTVKNSINKTEQKVNMFYSDFNFASKKLKKSLNTKDTTSIISLDELINELENGL